jgi:hypothetical protein
MYDFFLKIIHESLSFELSQEFELNTQTQNSPKMIHSNSKLTFNE